MPQLETIEVEAPPGYENGDNRSNSDTPSSDSPQITTSTISSPEALNSPSPSSSALYRLLNDPNEIHNGENLLHIPHQYQSIAFPREQTLLDLLIQSSGIQDLTQIRHLREVKLKVIASLVSLSRLEIYTPNVRVLKLDGSGLVSLREIGTSLNNLKELHVARCNLTSLDGTFGLTSLVELYASENHITNVGPLAMLENIKIINLDKNPISSLNNVSLLSLCPSLYKLSIRGTPLSKQICYKQNIKNVLPNLQYLDGHLLSGNLEETNINESIESINNGHKLNAFKEEESESCSLDISSMTEPSSDSFDGKESPAKSEEQIVIHVKRPATALGCSSAFKSQLNIAQRPRSAMPRSSSITESVIFSEEISEASPSCLTSGGIVCGNIARALSRARPVRRPIKPSSTKPVDAWVIGPPSKRKNKIQIEAQTSDVQDYTSSSSDEECQEATQPTYHRTILNEAKRMLDEPLPMKPEESTPVVDLELGIAGSTSMENPKSSERIQWDESSKKAIKTSKQWRKAFKLYREHKKFGSFSEESSVSDTD